MSGPARQANFTLRRIARNIPASIAAARFVTLQRSGQYSELRFIQRGKSAFDIVGYKWPDKGARRKYNIGRARVNPTEAKGPTDNQVKFGSRGKTKIGWISSETPKYYKITYKIGSQTRTVTRLKNKVKFVKTGKYGKAIQNRCPKTSNPSITEAVKRAAELSRKFYGLAPRKLRRDNITWPDALIVVGKCAQVDYIADKFDGKTRHYYHKFEGPTELFASDQPQKDGSNLLIIRGKFKIKKEGITG